MADDDTPKKPEVAARFTDPLHPDWDPRNLPPEVEAKLRGHLQALEPNSDSLLRILAQGAAQLGEVQGRILRQHMLCKMAGPPLPCDDETMGAHAAEIVGIAQGTHVALDLWFTKLKDAMRADAAQQAVKKARAKQPDPAPRRTQRGTTLH